MKSRTNSYLKLQCLHLKGESHRKDSLGYFSGCTKGLIIDKGYTEINLIRVHLVQILMPESTMPEVLKTG